MKENTSFTIGRKKTTIYTKVFSGGQTCQGEIKTSVSLKGFWTFMHARSAIHYVDSIIHDFVLVWKGEGKRQHKAHSGFYDVR
jgi:hypothetical protein